MIEHMVRKDKLEGYWHEYDEIQLQIDTLEQNSELIIAKISKRLILILRHECNV